MREVNHLKSSDQELGVERNLYFNEVFIESGLTSFVSSQRRRREKKEEGEEGGCRCESNKLDMRESWR